MAWVQLPKFYVNDIEILITKEISIGIYFRLDLDVEKTFKNTGVFEFSISHFVVPFCVRHEEHSVDYTYRIKILKLSRAL